MGRPATGFLGIVFFTGYFFFPEEPVPTDLFLFQAEVDLVEFLPPVADPRPFFEISAERKTVDAIGGGATTLTESD